MTRRAVTTRSMVERKGGISRICCQFVRKMSYSAYPCIGDRHSKPCRRSTGYACTPSDGSKSENGSKNPYSTRLPSLGVPSPSSSSHSRTHAYHCSSTSSSSTRGTRQPGIRSGAAPFKLAPESPCSPVTTSVGPYPHSVIVLIPSPRLFKNVCTAVYKVNREIYRIPHYTPYKVPQRAGERGFLVFDFASSKNLT
eukprot:1643314-Rhodomonas_salina.3